MSQVKIPAILLCGAAIHISMRPPTPAASSGERKMGDGPVEMHLATFVTRYASWLHAAIELSIIIAASTQLLEPSLSENIIGFLLPKKDPSRIFLSPAAVLGIISIAIGSTIRYACYRELGRHFTFHVTVLENHKLITTGPYGYVRHPAYSGGCLCYVGMALWYMSEGSWLRESEVWKRKEAWLVLIPLLLAVGTPIMSVFYRVPGEDKMLKKEFGKEWEAWASRVRYRLIPGIY